MRGHPSRDRVALGGSRRVIGLALVAALVVGVGAACAADGDRPGPPVPSGSPGPEPSDPSSTPAPTPAPTTVRGPLPDIPIRSAAADAASSAPPVPPVSLAIPALGVDLPVDAVGVQPDGQMEIPPLAERAGWYRFGAAPGQGSGAAVIAAHVDSIASAGLGPFARLKDLVAGDGIEVRLQDGEVLGFSVRTVERIAKPEVSWADYFALDGPSRLVLVTCGGTFQRSEGHYSDNVIVSADLVATR